MVLVSDGYGVGTVSGWYWSCLFLARPGALVEQLLVRRLLKHLVWCHGSVRAVWVQSQYSVIAV
jgi:uncharacterized membrane protein YqaE (UPF0057 family)